MKKSTFLNVINTLVLVLPFISNIDVVSYVVFYFSVAVANFINAPFESVQLRIRNDWRLASAFVIINIMMPVGIHYLASLI